MTLEEYVKVLPSIHLARRQFEQLQAAQSSGNLFLKWGIAVILIMAIGFIVGACIGEYRAELRQPKPCNHPSHLSFTNDGSNVLRP